MSKIDISFIVPVYNVEKYLSECLDSILNQKNISSEVILINDGSSDNSIEICKKYESIYPNIFIINKKNEGVSVARNEGIKISNGKYICFMDSDDFYCMDFVKKFIDISNKYNLDILRGCYKCLDEETGLYSDNKSYFNYANKIITGDQFLVYSIQNNTNEVVPWLGLFKREFLIKNRIFFPEFIDYEEDQLFFLKCLLGKKCKIMQLNDIFYVYRKRKGSCTAQPKKKNILDVCYVVDEELKYINSLALNNAKQEANIYVSWSFFQLTTLFGRLNKEDQKEIYEKIPKELMNHAIRYPSSKKNRYKVLLLRYFPKLYIIIYKIIRKEVL